MKSLQEVFNQIQVVKKQQKDIRSSYRDALANSQEFQQAKDQLEALKLKKKQIEDAIKLEYASELNKLDELKTELEEQTTMLSDIALTKLMNGEQIEEIVDTKNQSYEPILSVKFKKSDVARQEETAAVKSTAADEFEDPEPLRTTASFLEINPSLD
ncbi:hypothetical protein HGA34_02740 [Candidatus Falkowbacteria bacterium]|nr:hypothetical protein [Candidatus Falkowbacteria bacterium]